MGCKGENSPRAGPGARELADNTPQMVPEELITLGAGTQGFGTARPDRKGRGGW